jgi:hypothetical protein
LILELVVVPDPAADFRHFFIWDDAAGRATASQSNGQIPDRPMAFALGAHLQAGLPPVTYLLDQRTAGISVTRGEKLRPTLPPLAEGPFRKPEGDRHLRSFQCKYRTKNRHFCHLRISWAANLPNFIDSTGTLVAVPSSGLAPWAGQ